LARRASHHAHASHAPKRLTPVAEINAQYAAFLAAFNNVLNSYVTSLNTQSTGTVTVSAMVTAAYVPPSPVIEVDNASVFGSEGTFASPLLATATLGSAPSLGQFILTGSSGNALTVSSSGSSQTALPVGTVLTASVPTSAQSSASSIFPSYVTNSTIQMAITLVKYFNNLPVVLPSQNAPPHTPVQRGAIQKYIYQSIASTEMTSLQQLLLDITLPATAGPDLTIYGAAVNSAVQESRIMVIGGIEQIYARTLLISANAPANRLGEDLNSSTSGTSSAGSSSTSATSSGSGTPSTSSGSGTSSTPAA
jgi:hypothetical protein